MLYSQEQLDAWKYESRKIYLDFNIQFRQYFEETVETSCMAWGMEVPGEWYVILRGMCAAVEEHKLPIEWAQIKEKFGGLRVYWDETTQLSDNEYRLMSRIVDRAETLVEAMEAHLAGKPCILHKNYYFNH